MKRVGKKQSLAKRRHFESFNFIEAKEFLRVINRVEDKALFVLAITTGIRREDIVKIELDRINLEGKEIIFWEEKKDRWWKVFLEYDTVVALDMYIQTIPKGQKLLFTFTGRTAYNRLQKYRKKAKIRKEIRFHDLRTTFIRLSKALGRGERYVMQQTGDSARVILEHYENYDDEQMHDITDSKSLLTEIKKEIPE